MDAKFTDDNPLGIPKSHAINPFQQKCYIVFDPMTGQTVSPMFGSREQAEAEAKMHAERNWHKRYLILESVGYFSIITPKTEFHPL